MADKTDNNQASTGLKGSRGVLIFFARFVIASVVLYLLYMKFGIYYMKIVAYGAKPLLGLFKYRIIMEKALAITEDISLNPVVFFSLLIAVQGIPHAARLRGAALGFLILTAANCTTVFLSFLSYYRGSEKLWTGTEFFSLTMNFFLPLLLWFLLLPVKYLFPVRGKS